MEVGDENNAGVVRKQEDRLSPSSLGFSIRIILECLEYFRRNTVSVDALVVKCSHLDTRVIHDR